MVTARKILESPIIYDIVISDFGRDAAIEYLRLVAAKEKQLINNILERENLEFFDEYRRIMYTTIADVAFFKELAILDSVAKKGFLTEDILIGVGKNPGMSQEFIDRVTLSVIQESLAAIERGHTLFRVMIPCNTLSNLAKHIGKIINSMSEKERFVKTNTPDLYNLDRLANTKFSIHTVPESVMHHLSKTIDSGANINLLVLGTSGTNKIYEALAKAYPVNILPIMDFEQRLIDQAIVASIGGDQDEILVYRTLLQKEIIEPRNSHINNMTILEACTDFRFGFGISSLELFAEAMVSNCYQFQIPLSRSNTKNRG